MKVTELTALLEELAPRELAMSWDRVGLQVGYRDAEVHKVYVALDADDRAVEQAIASGCDFLLTHHPMVFDPLYAVTEDSLAGRRLLRLVRAGVNAYAMHTNYDSAPAGMAEQAARRLGLVDAVPMDAASGLGRIGLLPEPLSLRELGELVRDRFALPYALMYGDEETRVKRVAVLPGSGKSEIELALHLGAEAYITGDIGHHAAIDAAAQGLALVDAGHAGLEWIFVPQLCAYLRERAPELAVVAEQSTLPGQLLIG